ncbi:helix-turn-helix domain-containing protein [Pedobacter petrophilus]|uniref:Helix-turn-helix domain-containing protein n=1 Tax=Pedobacter petrophilus TaxID=1908241 RepID=A0A7K0G0L0_9SPHI|nr:helix-turn-helix domain-containing protein [Pedobacter petrophilus]MRX77387.1 helix-turn-helix domain-containing protein [Pedobacter petrophilus]
MKLLEYIDRIRIIHKLIKESHTGVPENFAKRLSISTSRLYVVLDELKLMGAPIEYSRQLQTYYYTQAFEVNIRADFTILKTQESISINAGFFVQQNYPLLFL